MKKCSRNLCLIGLDPTTGRMEEIAMKRTFDIFAYPKGNTEQQQITEHNFTTFVSALSAAGRKFTATPWSSDTETGFIVWHYQR